MNSKLNEFAEQAKMAGSTASAKAKDLSDTVRIKTEITKAKQKKEQLLMKLGDILYQKEKSLDQKDPTYENLVEAISSYEQVIDAKNEILASIQNGTVPEEQKRVPGDNEMYCPSCRKVIPKGKRYCMYCGCDLKAENL